jgi:hypothetical protein
MGHHSGVVLANTFYVAKNGNDTSGDGSAQNPYLTVQKALSMMTSTRNAIIVNPGVYTETLAFTNDGMVYLDLRSANIVGDVTWNCNPATNYQAKFIIEGHDLRSGYVGYLSNVIDGNVIVNNAAALSRYAAIHMINTGIRGNVTYTGPGGGGAKIHHLFMVNSFWTGTLSTTGNAQIAVYAWNCNTSTTYALGAATLMAFGI